MAKRIKHKCGAVLVLQPQHEGKTLRCPGCSAKIRAVGIAEPEPPRRRIPPLVVVGAIAGAVLLGVGATAALIVLTNDKPAPERPKEVVRTEPEPAPPPQPEPEPEPEPEPQPEPEAQPPPEPEPEPEPEPQPPPKPEPEPEPPPPVEPEVPVARVAELATALAAGSDVRAELAALVGRRWAAAVQAATGPLKESGPALQALGGAVGPACPREEMLKSLGSGVEAEALLAAFAISDPALMEKWLDGGTIKQQWAAVVLLEPEAAKHEAALIRRLTPPAGSETEDPHARLLRAAAARALGSLKGKAVCKALEESVVQDYADVSSVSAEAWVRADRRGAVQKAMEWIEGTQPRLINRGALVMIAAKDVSKYDDVRKAQVALRRYESADNAVVDLGRVLVELDAKRAVADLIEELNYLWFADPMMHFFATSGLSTLVAETKDPRYCEFVKGKLDGTISMDNQLTAQSMVDDLENFPGSETEAYLKKLAEHSAQDDSIRSTAAATLLKMGGAARLPVARALLKESDFSDVYRSSLIEKIGRLKMAEAVPMLMEFGARAEKSGSVRASAVGALGEIGDRKAVPFLIEMLDEPDREYSEPSEWAWAALKRISGQELPKDAAAWKRWSAGP